MLERWVSSLRRKSLGLARTEESFHDNQKQPREYGGLWAEVLEEEVSFTVER